MSTLKVSSIAHPSAVSTAFTLHSDGSVTLGPSVSLGGFDSGTALLFQQTNAPTGWTKSTTHNDKTLRVVSGAASSGGSTAFTTVFASRTLSGTVGSTTLTTSQIPSHKHTVTFSPNSGSSQIGYNFGYFTNRTNTVTNDNAVGSTGGGSSHDHSFTGSAMDFAVQYVDVIIATKD